MTKTAYIVHGCCGEDDFFSKTRPSLSNSHWIPWLQKQLLMAGYNCQTPEMPMPYQPSYAAWKKQMDCYLVDAQTTLIAHSCGCGFLLRWLSENNKHIHKLVLVAPWSDPAGYRGTFLEGTLNPKLEEHVGAIHIFHSSNEPIAGVQETVEMLRKMYSSATFHHFAELGHFCFSDLGTEAFPELLKTVVA